MYIYLYSVLQVRGRALVLVCTCDCLSWYAHVIVCHTCIYSLPLFIQWFQFTYNISTVCLHFTCESGCAGGCGPVCTVAFYKYDVGNACFFCFCLRLSRVVGNLTDRRCWCWGWNLYLRFSIFVLFRVCTIFHIYTCLSIGVRQSAGVRLNSCYTHVTPSRVIHVCLRVFVFHLCIRVCTVCFKFW